MAVRINASGEGLVRTANLPSPSSFTIMGWSKFVADRSGVFRYFAALEANPNNWLILGWDGANAFQVASSSFGGSNTFTNFSSGPAVGDVFVWAIVGSSSGAGGFTGYWRAINSNTWNTASTDGESFTATQLTIGNDTFDEWCDMHHFNVKCWDRALTADELLVESYYRRPVFPASLNFWWPLDLHTNVQDYGGNGRNATANGTLTTEESGGQMWRPGPQTPPAVDWNTSGTGPRSVPLAGAGPSGSGAFGFFTQSTASTGNTGTLAATLDALTLAGTGALPIRATASVTLDALTLAGTGALAIAGTGAATLGDLTLAGTGALAIVGQGAATLDALTLAGTGALAIVGQGAATLEDLTLAGTGTLSSGGITGTLSKTLDDLTLAGTGALAIVGQLATTLEALAAAGTGKLAIAGTGAATLDALTAAGTGQLAIRGTGAATLADVTLAGTGSSPRVGQASITLEDVTVAGQGNLPLVGTLDATFAALNLSGSGNGPGGGGPVERAIAHSPISKVGTLLAG